MLCTHILRTWLIYHDVKDTRTDKTAVLQLTCNTIQLRSAEKATLQLCKILECDWFIHLDLVRN